MPQQLIEQYYSKVERIKQYGGSNKENQIRAAFEALLEQLCVGRNLELIHNLGYRTKNGGIRYPDGTLKDALRQDWGYWESKDEYDSLDDEIKSKINDGYPTSNIIFEDGEMIVLFQRDQEIGRAIISDSNAFEAILNAFFSYEPREVQDFHEAIERFKVDLPALLIKLREMIEQQAQYNDKFVQARENFLVLCQKSINPYVVLADVREMIIQHILTEEIFTTVFNDAQFHRENNISRELTKIVDTFFKGEIRRNILRTIDPYYAVIKAKASNIQDHHEKQRFLKVLYETFYRAYNPAAADRLGIIYTPEEIVRFMIDATNHLLEAKFSTLLSHNEVEILDPACGTGTFITEIIDQMPSSHLSYKYKNEIHCNEVAILPYYVANLNIEYTFAQKMNSYVEFKHICFVDTLDNLGFTFEGKKYPLPFDMSAENLDRIKDQNERVISVIIGNPPYNANQKNENENNKNREYKMVDGRIKGTYIKYSKARKTKSYDMYSRFLRWSSDRLTQNGIIAFVLNNSFAKKDSWDGFRKVVAEEFNEVYIIDMKGDAHTSGEQRRREGGNIFSDKIKVGIAIFFLVRKAGVKGCQIFYSCVDDYMRANAKLSFLRDNKFQDLRFERILPDADYNWLNIPTEDWSNLLPIATQETKYATSLTDANAIFKRYSNGINTARDGWVIDISANNLRHKMKFFSEFYNSYRHVNNEPYDPTIKWSRNLKERFGRRLKERFDSKRMIEYLYRPYSKRYLYYSDIFIDEHGIANDFMCDNNVMIAINVGSKQFNVIASKYLVDWHFNGDSRCIPLCYSGKSGHRTNNITSYALSGFKEHYEDDTIKPKDIFSYVYAVLHHPLYRQKYEINLKRKLPRIPFYDNFRDWVKWGDKLLNYHVNYESMPEYPLHRVDLKGSKIRQSYKPILKVDKDRRLILIDSITTLEGVPPAVWEYQLGNISAIEWVAGYYKQHTVSDPTIRDKFNTYRFADYKEQAIELFQRVCTVSVETMKIIEEMPK